MSQNTEQLKSQDSVSQTVYSGWGLVWFDPHNHSLQKLEGIFHGIRILQINTVDDAHKHCKAMCRIFDVVNDNSLPH